MVFVCCSLILLLKLLHCADLKVTNMLLDNYGAIKLSDYIASQEISDLIHSVPRKNVSELLGPDTKLAALNQRFVSLQ